MPGPPLRGSGTDLYDPLLRAPLTIAEIPLFLVREGHIVRNVGHRRWEPIAKDHDEAAKILRAAVPPQELLYLWDIDGVDAGAANHEFFQRLERHHVPMWIDAGCRNPEDAMDAFFAGAEVLTIRVESMQQEQLADFADLAEGEFHLSVRIPVDAPEVPLTAGDLRTLVGELHANGVIVEALGTSRPAAVAKFARLITDGGVDVSLLSTERLAWLPKAAADSGAVRIIRPGATV